MAGVATDGMKPLSETDACQIFKALRGFWGLMRLVEACQDSCLTYLPVGEQVHERWRLQTGSIIL